MIEVIRRYRMMNEMDQRRILRVMDRWLADYEPADKGGEEKPAEQSGNVVVLFGGGPPAA